MNDHFSIFEMEPGIRNDIVNRVPYDIIVKILSYLPATYRKQARLVCTEWCEASNDITIVKHQKFILYNYYRHVKLNSMFQILRDTKINYLNLEFGGEAVCSWSDFNEQFNSFLESHGSVIHSLCFRRCTVSSETIEKIMISCINLEELIFVHHEFHSRIPLRIPLIDDIEIKRNRLTVLKFMNCRWITDQVLMVFISVYDQLKELVLSGIDMIYTETDIYKENIVSYRYFYQIVSQKCQNIKKLNLSYGDRSTYGLSDHDLATLASSFQLNELNLSNHKFISTDGFKNFLFQQKNLISVDLSKCDNFDFECLQLLLNQNQNLKYLNVKISNCVPKVKLLECLEKSQLKSFQCNINAEYLELKVTTSGRPHKMEKLTFFTINNDVDTFSVLFPMLQMFRNLTYLDLSFCQTAEGLRIFSFIFREMIHLKTIILKQCNSWIDDSSFENTTGRLQNLEHLNLSGCKLTTTGIKNFYYPKLRFLNLSTCYNVNEDALVHLVETSPLLEDLKLSGTITNLERSIIIFQKLKFLRRLWMDGERRRQDFCTFCSFSCPLLRYVEITSTVKRENFIYDPNTGSLLNTSRIH